MIGECPFMRMLAVRLPFFFPTTTSSALVPCISSLDAPSDRTLHPGWWAASEPRVEMPLLKKGSCLGQAEGQRGRAHSTSPPRCRRGHGDVHLCAPACGGFKELKTSSMLRRCPLSRM